MRLFIDVDSRQFVRSANYPQPIASLTLKRRDNMQVLVQFVQDNTVVMLGEEASGKLGIKAAYSDQAFLAVDTTWTPSEEAQNYAFSLNLDTAEMATAFDSDPEAIDALFEIEWTVDGLVTSTLKLPITIENDVISGSEGTPEVALDLKASQSDAEAGTNNEKWMTPLRTAQAIAALAKGNNQIVSSGDISNLTSNQQAAISEGTIVTTTDGRRWVYSGTGSKTSEASYVELADVTPEWTAIANKPNLLEADIVAQNGLTFDNGAKLQKGTTDAGLGGGKGVALKCSLNYEHKWEAGRLYTMEQDGFTIRRVEHCFTATPTATDDETKGFVVGSRWILDDGTTYECNDASQEAAQWQEVTVNGGGGSTNYILKDADFTAEAGKNYAVDKHLVPAVMPTAIIEGIKFIGTSTTQSTEIYIGDDVELYTSVDDLLNLSILINPFATTYQNVVDLVNNNGNGITLCQLLPGVDGNSLFIDYDLSATLTGGSAAGFAGVEVTLPANPATGDVVGFADARGQWGNYPLLVLRNGKKIEGGTANFINNAAGTFFAMVYIDNTTGWRVLSSGTKPLNLTAPTIEGTYSFTSTPGTWTGSPTSYTYQWQMSDDGETGWADIEDATASSYLAVEADEGKYVRVGVIATNANGPSIIVYSAASAAINLPDFPTTGLLAFYKLDNLNDSSGNGYTLTNNNTATFVSGKIGNAVQLGGGSFLSNSSVLSSFPNSLTYSAWIYADTSHIGVVMSRHANSGVQIYVNGTIITAQVGVSGSASTSFSIGQWTHIVLTVTASGIVLYKNGESSTPGNYSSTSGDTATQFLIGANCEGGVGSYTFSGKIDAVGLWNRILTTQEITQIYNSGNGLEP